MKREKNQHPASRDVPAEQMIEMASEKAWIFK